jgi:hypothetical protein
VEALVRAISCGQQLQPGARVALVAPRDPVFSAIWALVSVCSESLEIKQRAAGAGVLEALVPLLLLSSSPLLVHGAVMALTVLTSSMDAGVARRAVAAGAREALSGVVAASGNEQVRQRAARVLLNIRCSLVGEGEGGGGLRLWLLGIWAWIWAWIWSWVRIWPGSSNGQAAAAQQAAQAAAAAAAAEPPSLEPDGRASGGGGGGAAATAASAACCAACGGRGDGQTKLRRCAGCKAVRYCGPDCQQAHWRLHRRECAAPRGRQQMGA